MKLKPIILIAVFVLCLGLLALVTERLHELQKTYSLNRLVINPDVPPSLALTTFALGPLRALVVDALWWRAIDQQDKGEYFDALQLADWITKLQPTFASVWSFLGWNMAYNISHDFRDPQERWKWIVQAISLLRDKGLVYNPDNTIIRHELARIFYDRIGSRVDPDTIYFKNQWAFLMMEYFVLGVREEIDMLLAAASTLEELKQRPQVAATVDQAARHGIDLYASPAAVTAYLNLGNTVDDPRLRPGLKEIQLYFRRHRIETELKLNLQRVAFIDREYGPLDWRLHQAHAIYWAAEEHYEDFLQSGVNYSKVVKQCMKDSFYEGRLFYDAKRNTITRTNNLEIIGKIHDYMEYLLEHSYSQQADEDHKAFLENAVTVLYCYNRDADARELYHHYVEDYGGGEELDYETFVVNSMERTLSTGIKSAGAVIEAALYQSYRWLDIGVYDPANGYYHLAQTLWRRHQEKHRNFPALQLPPFAAIAESAKQSFIQSASISAAEFKQKSEEFQHRSGERINTGTLYKKSSHHHHH